MSIPELSISERHISTEPYSIQHQPQNPIFREIKQIATEVEAVARVLSNLKDTVVVGPIIRVAMERINISITHMTHRQNSTAHLVVYVVVIIIP